MKRLFYLSAVLSALAILFTACGEDGPTAVTTDSLVVTSAPETINTVSPPETETIVVEPALVSGGTANYSIIRAEMADEDTVQAVGRIRSAIGDVTDVYPDLGTDWVKPGIELDHTALQILVGPTAYSESAQAMADVGYGDYIITRVGAKLVINAWSSEALDRAITAFIDEVNRLGTKDELVLAADLRLTGTENELINHLPVYPGRQIRTVYDVGDENGVDCRLLVVDDTNTEEFVAYRAVLEAAGYTLHSENDIANNRFATYVNDSYVISAGYYAYENAARLTIEPRTVLPPCTQADSVEQKVQPNFTMIGLEYPSNTIPLTQNGMSFVFQLSDGSYIIIDGGLNRPREAKMLYDHMRKNAPEPNNITIAAWIITHAHTDHYSGYLNFSKAYASRVKLELLISNFPSERARADAGLLDQPTQGEAGYTTIQTSLEAFDGAQYLKVHTGQRIYLRDAEIEFLYTHESIAPGLLTDYNTTSLVFSVVLGGQKFLILGDATNDACTIVHEMYGDYLRSDFVQTAHHGYGTGSHADSGVTSVYTAAAAPVVLWPVGQIDYATMHNQRYNAHLQELETTKEIIVAGSRNVTLVLPYTYGTGSFDSILK